VAAQVGQDRTNILKSPKALNDTDLKKKARKLGPPPLPPLPPSAKMTPERLRKMASRIGQMGPPPPSKLTVLHVRADLESSPTVNGPWTVQTNITFASYTNPPGKMFFRSALSGSSTSSVFQVTAAKKDVLLYARNPAVTNFPPVPKAQVTLAWDSSPPSENVEGYRVYYGVSSRAYTNYLGLGNVNSATVSNISHYVKYYYAVTARNLAGLESDYSEELSYTAIAKTNKLVLTFGVDDSPDMKLWNVLGRTNQIVFNPPHPMYYRSVISLDSEQVAMN
jgi:hypothetical protein